jgi:transcriptional regulator with XRE-family HTH domain
MEKRKEELLTIVEFCKRTGKNRTYFSKLKRDSKYNNIWTMPDKKKIKYLAACEFLGYPLDKLAPETNESKIAKLAYAKKRTTKIVKKDIPSVEVKKVKKKIKPEDLEDFDPTTDAISLLDQIMLVINDSTSDVSWEKLQNLENKAKILKIYFASQKEKVNYDKEMKQLINRPTLEKIIGFTIAAIRTSLINLPNNYAVSLEGLDKVQIKDYVADDINRILSGLQGIDEKFDELIDNLEV